MFKYSVTSQIITRVMVSCRRISFKRYLGVSSWRILCNKISLFVFRCSFSSTHPSSVSNFSCDVPFLNPVIMRAASSYTLSSKSDSCIQQLSQTILPYSSIGRINPIYNCSNDCLSSLCFINLKMLILLQTLVYISLIWSLHLPFELKVTPRCLWDFERSGC